MDPGKSAAQACHAARLSLLHYLKLHPHRADDFLAVNSAGTMVVLDVPDLDSLHRLAAHARARGLPHALFVDSGHVCPPSFDGSPIPTALAIGPALRTEIRPFTRGLRRY